jgi:amino acid adenylation domain-containing protein
MSNSNRTAAGRDAEPAQIEAWLIRRAAELLGADSASVSGDAGILELGLASKDLLAMAADAEDWLGTPVSAELLYESRSLSDLARRLSGSAAAPAADGPAEVRSFVALLREKTSTVGGAVAFRFIGSGGPAAELSYRQLDLRARAIAARLQSIVSPGERALLLYEPGLGYIEAFFGCLYAGVVAVPVYPLRRRRRVNRLEPIARDARPRLALSLSSSRDSELHREPFDGMLWVGTGEVPDSQAESWRPHAPDPEDLAFLQYTSGSTQEPKGVMVTHGNVLANVEAIRVAFQVQPGERLVAWLPPYHDMGLIGCVLAAVGTEVEATLMSSETFVRRPALWLQTISERRAAITGAPNFAYEYCVDRIDERQKADLDLSSLRLAFNGAEPIQAETLDRFTAAFAGCGFDRSAFYPCYGMAESTLLVAGSELSSGARTLEVDRRALETGRAVPHAGGARIVGYPHKPATLDIRIVDASGPAVCHEGVVGEIWVDGTSVCAGYWNQPELSDETFGAVLAEHRDRRFLRTGDLGFMLEGVLYVTGRIKDVLILRGRNHYPQDVEAAAQGAHVAFHGRPSAAFTLSRDGVEADLVIVQEVGRRYASDASVGLLGARVAEVVSEQLDLVVSRVVLVESGSVPRTTSGKIRRSACRELWERGDLQQVGEWARPGAAPVKNPDSGRSAAGTAGGTESDEWSGPSEDASAAPEEVPLSFGQQSLWFLYRTALESPAYNEVLALDLRGEIDVALLRRALDAVVDRHPLLRARYADRQGRAVQWIAPESVVPLASIAREGASDEEIRGLMRSLAASPFELSEAPPLRLWAIRRAPRHQIWLLSVHHIASDAASLRQIVHEIFSAYAALGSGATADLGAPPAPYREFVEVERRAAGDPALRAFWRSALPNPAGTARLPVLDHRGDELRVSRFALPPSLVGSARNAAREHKVTLYVLLLASFNALLQRYTGEDEITVGTPATGRIDPRLRSTVGYLLNTVPIRTRVSGASTFADWLRETEASVTASLRHQMYPFMQIVEDANVPRDARVTPIFQVLFGLLRAPKSDVLGAALLAQDPDRAVTVGQLELRVLPVERPAAQFDLTVDVVDSDARVDVVWRSREAAFESEFIVRMHAHWTRLLEAALREPHADVYKLPMLSPEESRRILCQWNQAPAAPADRTCLHQLVESQARLTPRAVAVVHGPACLSYAELNGKANTLARGLQAAGVRRGDVVAVVMGRGLPVPVAFLAVMKAGAAFLPLDPAWPLQRLERLVESAEVRVGLSDAGSAQAASGIRSIAVHVADVETLNETEDLGLVQSADDAIYAIPTSGSTGTPKLAVNAHRGVVNRLHAMSRAYGDAANEVVVQTTHHVFDSAVWELFWPLTRAGRTVIPDWTDGLDLDGLIELVAREHATTLDLYPSTFDLLVGRIESDARARRKLVSVRHVIVGGEAVRPGTVARFMELAAGVKVTNFYGPTEASIGSISHEIGRGERAVPIGRPIPGTAAVICDRHLGLMPIGAVGELVLGGDCVGLGYRGDAAGTEAAFVPNPFPELWGDRLYRTGDLARYRSDGSIEYVGRRDEQIKLHGFRISLADINAAVETHPAVEASATVCTGSGDARKIVSYVVPARDGAAADPRRIRRELGDQLPRYMVPTMIVLLDELPRDSSGKLATRLLPPVELAREAREHAPPRDAAERWLAKVWSEVLDVRDIGVHDSFFDLGGASIATLQVEAHARDAGIALRAVQIFEHQTIAELAAALEGVNWTRIAAPLEGGTASVDTPESPLVSTSAQPSAMRIASLGVYLPERRETLAERIQGARTRVRFPLAQMTGIRSVSVAAEAETALELARRAAEDCLMRSSIPRGQIEAVIWCAISRADGPRSFVLEPSMASQLCAALDIHPPYAFDVANACAGTFTGLVVAQSLLANGVASAVLVASGELISPLSATAQRELSEEFLDNRLACFTLADSGLALLVDRSSVPGVGFQALQLFSLGRYALDCVGKASATGPIMQNEPITASEARNLPGARHASAVLRAHGWTGRPQHVILHQTSETTLRDAIKEASRVMGTSLDTENVVFNVSQRGNTATNSHFVALLDEIERGRIRAGERIVFGVSGSGQTLGTALYQLDDLPDRLRHGARSPERATPPRTVSPASRPVRVLSTGSAYGGSACGSSFADGARRAAATCLGGWSGRPSEIDLVIFGGVYRPEFLSEPALAAILAGDLDINATMDSAQDRRTLAFDVIDGALGLLTGLHVASELIGAGQGRTALIVAAEADPEGHVEGRGAFPIEAAASAVLIEASPTRPGFEHFCFRSYPGLVAARRARAQWGARGCALAIEESPGISGYYLECMRTAVSDFCKETGLSVSSFDHVLLPFWTRSVAGELASAVGARSSQLYWHPEEGSDLFTSWFCMALSSIQASGRARPGENALIIAVGSGIRVGCTTYRF